MQIGSAHDAKTSPTFRCQSVVFETARNCYQQQQNKQRKTITYGLVGCNRACT